MNILVDGVDISDTIAYGGFHLRRKDIEGKNAGYNLKGNYIRDRSTTKTGLDIKCLPLKSSRFKGLMDQIAPEYVTVTLDDETGASSFVMFAPNANADFDKSTGYWTDTGFSMEER